MSGVKAYLIAYNIIQLIGWFAVLYTQRLDILCIFQTIQLLEVVHCIVGFVKSSAFQTFMQILSRIIIVWAALVPFEAARQSTGFSMILIAWPIAETTRYLYYAINLVNLDVYLVTWARYTFFIVLYPLGVSGELLILWKMRDVLIETKVFDYPLPNRLNVSIYGTYVLAIIMFSYIPFFPKLYLYMLSQRKKFLGGKEIAKQSTRQKSD